MHAKVQLESLNGRDHLEDLGQGWRTFLRVCAQIVDNFLINSFACPWEFYAAK